MGIIEQAIAIAKEEGIEKGIKKGLAQGIEKGIEQGKIEVVLNAHQAGLAIDLIARLVELPEVKVLAILQERT